MVITSSVAEFGHRWNRKPPAVAASPAPPHAPPATAAPSPTGPPPRARTPPSLPPLSRRLYPPPAGIAERLPKRTEHAIRNRWHRLQTQASEESSNGAAGMLDADALAAGAMDFAVETFAGFNGVE